MTTDPATSANGEAVPEDFTATEQREEARGVLRDLVNGISVPFYAAIGLGDAVLSSTEKAINKTRKQLNEADLPLVDRAKKAIDDSAEKLKEKTGDLDGKFLHESHEDTITDLFDNVRSSTEKLFKGLARRGYRVLVQDKPADPAA